MAKEYSHIFEKLIHDTDDTIGMIAYCLYKKHKIEVLQNIRDSKGREPTDEELSAFILFSSSDSQLEKYRLEGEMILSEMVSNINDEEMKRFESMMLSEYRENIRTVLPSDLKSVGLSMLAAFLFSVMVGVFFFLTDTSEKAVKENTEHIIQVIRQELNPSRDSLFVKPMQE